MPLMPKRVKYRKVQRGSRKGLANSGNKIAYGEYGLQALAWMDFRCSDRGLSCCCKSADEKKREALHRIFPSKPITKKPLEVRMGKGKVELISGLLL